jgi:hypothetical protein
MREPAAKFIQTTRWPPRAISSSPTIASLRNGSRTLRPILGNRGS